MYIKVHQTADITEALLFYCTHKFYSSSGVCIALTEYARSRGEKHKRFMPIIKTLPCLAQEAEMFALTDDHGLIEGDLFVV